MSELSEEVRKQIDLDALVKHLGNSRGTPIAKAGFIEGAQHQHPIAFEQGRMQGKFEAIDHILESLESGQIQTWAATVHHLKVLKEAAVKQLEAI